MILQVHALSIKYDVSALRVETEHKIFLTSQHMGLIELVKVLDEANFLPESFPEFAKYLGNRLFSSTLAYDHVDTNYVSLNTANELGGSVAQLLLKILLQVSRGQFIGASNYAVDSVVKELRKREKEAISRAIGSQDTKEATTMWMWPKRETFAPKRGVSLLDNDLDGCSTKKDEKRRKKEAAPRMNDPRSMTGWTAAPGLGCQNKDGMFSFPTDDPSSFPIYTGLERFPVDWGDQLEHAYPRQGAHPGTPHTYAGPDISSPFPIHTGLPQCDWTYQPEYAHPRNDATLDGPISTGPTTWLDAENQTKVATSWKLPGTTWSWDRYDTTPEDHIPYQQPEEKRMQNSLRKEQITEALQLGMQQKSDTEEISQRRNEEQNLPANTWGRGQTFTLPDRTTKPSTPTSQQTTKAKKAASEQDYKLNSQTAESSSSVSKPPKTLTRHASKSPSEFSEDDGFYICPIPPEKKSLNTGYTFI
ncbi:hypothetical protein FBEOM_12841 [Fusarium beomiforme]|uniref:Uncharacterized protein n=1 Tax=Fusarium beomiforme TaxID=44412 RepID=A0A9P5DT01_9HYPO|nr:hypothetical protein FBEOM_12841 [Fusarium beomiforme]